MHSICAENRNASQGKEGEASANGSESLIFTAHISVILVLSMMDMTSSLTAGFRVVQRYDAGNTAD
jgi:hypothetical protein